jgi:hypothetical protein
MLIRIPEFTGQGDRPPSSARPGEGGEAAESADVGGARPEWRAAVADDEVIDCLRYVTLTILQFDVTIRKNVTTPRHDGVAARNWVARFGVQAVAC